MLWRAGIAALYCGFLCFACAQKLPQEAVSTFQVVPGLELRLFASEPLMVNPTCFDIDHRGRLWVCESVNYRCRLRNRPLNRKEGDRIVVLEDLDGDGKADRETTFYQSSDFIAPLGIAVAPNPRGKGQRVYVCHSPYIYVFEDLDDDLRADSPPKILLQGFRGYDHDHGVHGIHFGPDGRLYFTCGDTGIDGLRDRWGNVWRTNNTDCQAATLWRCDADGSNLELLAHNFRNPYEPAIDSFGTLFVSDNDDDGSQQTRICHVLFGGNYGYWPRGREESHWHEEQPGVVHKVLRTWAGSPTGMAWYEGDLIPWTGGRKAEHYYGRLIHTDAGPRQVRIYYVRIKGAGFEIDREDIVNSQDQWFRPSDICVAPDGSLFVSDWYDPGVGGHGMGDVTRGRIYRIVPRGCARYRVSVPDWSSDTGIIAGLRSPNLSVRYGSYQAFRELPLERQSALAREVLRKESDLVLCARVAWLISQQQNWERWWPLLSKKSLDARWQMMLVRIAKDRAVHLRRAPEPVLRWLRDLIRPETPLPVLREVVLALRDEDPEFAKPWFESLAKLYPGGDHFYLVALGIAAGHFDTERREKLFADFEQQFPHWDEKVLDLVWELRPPAVIRRLDQKILDPRFPLPQRLRMIDALASTEESLGGEVMLRVLSQELPAELRQEVISRLKRHLSGKWSGLQGTSAFQALIRQWLRDPHRQSDAVELIAATGRESWIGELLELASDWQRPLTLRQKCIQALGMIGAVKATQALADLLNDKSVVSEVLVALGRQATPQSLEVLIKFVRQDNTPLNWRLDAVQALALSRPGATWLLEHYKELNSQVQAEAARLLRHSPFPDLRSQARSSFPETKLNPRQPPAIANLVTLRGDAQRGQRLFFEDKNLGCARCHMVNGRGGKVGPDLSAIGSKASRENLFESILYPDKAVADQFIQWVVETKEGLVIQGILVEDGNGYLVLRDADGKDWKVNKSDVLQRVKSPKSIMPADLIQSMSVQDLVDLVEFLQTLRSEPDKTKPSGR